MIIKSLSRKSGPKQLFTYIFQKEKVMRDKNGKPLVIKHNLRERSVIGYAREFANNELLRLRCRKDSVLLHHTIISFSKEDKDKITPELLKDIANKYISLRGKDSLFCGSIHIDAAHLHLHLIQSGVQYLTGKSSRISKQEFHSIKLTMDAHQREKYPQLVHSLPDHHKRRGKYQSKEEMLAIKRNERISDKQKLLEVLETAYRGSTSKEQFLEALKTQGHTPYYRNGRLTGIQFNGEEKFRLNRIGYDESKLNTLSERSEREERELSEIRSIRESRTESRMDDRSVPLPDEEEDDPIQKDEDLESENESDKSSYYPLEK